MSLTMRNAFSKAALFLVFSAASYAQNQVLARRTDE